MAPHASKQLLMTTRRFWYINMSIYVENSSNYLKNSEVGPNISHSLIAHFGCEIQNGPITMKFYLQVFHSYQTQNILLKYAFFHFWGIFWSFLGNFGPFLTHFGCEIQNPQITMKFYLQVFHSYQTNNILLKFAFFIFGAFFGHF